MHVFRIWHPEVLGGGESAGGYRGVLRGSRPVPNADAE